MTRPKRQRGSVDVSLTHADADDEGVDPAVLARYTHAPHDQPTPPHKALARAVLEQAIRDVMASDDVTVPPAPTAVPRSAAYQRERRRVTPYEHRVDALDFLSTDTIVLRVWCWLADVDPARLIEQYDPHIEQRAA